MLLKKTALLTFLAFLLDLSTAQTNWCNVPGCNTNHIACNNNGAFAPICVNPSQVPMTAPLRTQILQLHNQRRNRIALGQEPRFQSARRMGQMVWNDDLAWLAELNTRQCEMRHDACRNTPAFRWAGQNLGSWGTSGAHFDPANVVNTMVDMWYDEHPFATQADINHLTRIFDEQNRAFGHFTVMVSERNIAVGCAISRYTSGGFNFSLMACNYASTNMIGSPVYRTGVAASGCTLGADIVYPGLCTLNEPIDPNSFD